MAQHKATLRKSMRSALKHRQLADKLLDNIVSVQGDHNTVVTKMNGAPATDYEASMSSASFEYDERGQVQHKAFLRDALVRALSHRKLANELIDSIEEIKAKYDAVAVQLDLDSGSPVGANYSDPAFDVVEVADADADGSEAQHQASFRKSMISAMSHRRLANIVVDAVAEMQVALNALIVDLKASTVPAAADVVEAIDPDGI